MYTLLRFIEQHINGFFFPSQFQTSLGTITIMC